MSIIFVTQLRNFIENDKKIGYYGGEVAAPVFKEIAEKLYVRTPKDIIVKSKNFANNFLNSYKQVILSLIHI